MDLYQQALNYLSRREYSQAELQRKLMDKGWELEQIRAVMEELTVKGLQSDERFVSALIHSRTTAGYGPRRILLELKAKGITQIPDGLLDENDNNWLKILDRVWRKKFANTAGDDLKSKVKQTRFLLQRGFSPGQISEFLKQKKA